MNASQMIELINRQPFKPIEVHLRDGGVFTVESPHLIATSRNQATFTVCSDDNDSARYVAYRNVTQVVTEEPTGA